MGAVKQSSFVKLYDAQVLVWHFSRFRSILCNSHGSCCFLVLAAKMTSQGWGGWPWDWINHNVDKSYFAQCVMCVYVYIYKNIFSQCPQMTVFKSQTRTDLHNLIMWLCGHLISLQVCWVLLSSLLFWELWQAPSLRDSRCFAQQIVIVRRTLSSVCLCKCTCGTPRPHPAGLCPPLECGWVQTSLFKWAASSRFKTMEWRF